MLKCCIYEQAYIQQLESSRIKLTQLEQELQRAGAQVIYVMIELIELLYRSLYD